jgi:hypothetical protein
VAAPSEATIVRVPRSQRCPDGCTGVHSYTSDDVRWCWQGADPARQALDAELTTSPPPPSLASRYAGDEDFWRVWTRLEVVAKLTDTPVLTLLGRGELGRPAPPGISVSHLERDGAVIALGTSA